MTELTELFGKRDFEATQIFEMPLFTAKQLLTIQKLKANDLGKIWTQAVGKLYIAYLVIQPDDGYIKIEDICKVCNQLNIPQLSSTNMQIAKKKKFIVSESDQKGVNASYKLSDELFDFIQTDPRPEGLVNFLDPG